jgi:lysophospholipase L1-like esterase
MPVGDSITMIPGYRVALFRKAKNAGRSITFVGSLSGGPATVDGAPFPAQHEGHNGHDVDGVHRLVEPPLMTYKPHVVLLMIGTNDAHRSPQVATAPARVGAMVDTIVQQVPDALVVVAKIVPTREDPASMYYRAGHDERIRAFNDALGPVLEARRRQGKHVVTVDMYAAFTANPAYKTAYMAENLHPTTAGFGVMADVWWAAIEPALK